MYIPFNEVSPTLNTVDSYCIHGDINAIYQCSPAGWDLELISACEVSDRWESQVTLANMSYWQCSYVNDTPYCL